MQIPITVKIKNFLKEYFAAPTITETTCIGKGIIFPIKTIRAPHFIIKLLNFSKFFLKKNLITLAPTENPNK